MLFDEILRQLSRTLPKEAMEDLRKFAEELEASLPDGERPAAFVLDPEMVDKVQNELLCTLSQFLPTRCLVLFDIIDDDNMSYGRLTNLWHLHGMLGLKERCPVEVVTVALSDAACDIARAGFRQPDDVMWHPYVVSATPNAPEFYDEERPEYMARVMYLRAAILVAIRKRGLVVRASCRTAVEKETNLRVLEGWLLMCAQVRDCTLQFSTKRTSA